MEDENKDIFICCSDVNGYFFFGFAAAGISPEQPTVYQLGQWRRRCALTYQIPALTPISAIVVGHPTSNSLGCGTAWASRGFLALCFNTRYVANETAISWETIILDVRSAVNFVKSQAGNY